MRKRTKQVLSAAMAAMMVMGMMTGCGKKDDKESTTKAPDTTAQTEGTTKAPETTEATTAATEATTEQQAETLEPVKMSMFAVTAGYTNLELPDVVAFQDSSKKFNIEWDVTSCMQADLTEKRGLLLSSGDYTDVLYKSFLTHNEIEKFGSQGVLIPLNDLIDQYAPKLKAALDKMDAWDYITASDGNIYALPELNKRKPQTILLWQNNRWLEKVGMEAPKSMDDLYNILKAFKEKDPNGNGEADEIPFEANVSVPPIYLVQYMIPIDFNTFCAVDGDKVVYVPRTETYKEFLRYLRKFYADGLMDKDCFTKTIDQQYAEGTMDKYGFFFDWSPSSTVGSELAVGFDYTVMTPFKENTLSTSSGIYEGAFAITDSCKDPVRAIQWADQFYDEEGGKLAIMGVEGKSYEYKDNGKWEWIVGGEYGEDESTVREKVALQGWAYNACMWPDAYYNDYDRDMTEVSGTLEELRVAALGADPFPAVQLSESESKDVGQISVDVGDYINQYLAKVTTGEKDLDATWDEYLSTLDAMGAARYEEIYNKAYQELKAK